MSPTEIISEFSKRLTELLESEESMEKVASSILAKESADPEAWRLLHPADDACRPGANR